MFISLADPQDITRAGLMYILSEMEDVKWRHAQDKTELILQLQNNANAIVVMDYTLFDVNDIEELIILSERFPLVHWIIFSHDLTGDFVKRLVVMSHQFSILLKDSSMREIRECLLMTSQNKRYICQRMTEILLTPSNSDALEEEKVPLTKTETEILKDVASGLTTKEIAAKRFSSFHTVNTHRKNIFRKLGVNNVHEAIRYALRAGLVDSAEYYI